MWWFLTVSAAQIVVVFLFLNAPTASFGWLRGSRADRMAFMLFGPLLGVRGARFRPGHH